MSGAEDNNAHSIVCYRWQAYSYADVCSSHDARWTVLSRGPWTGL